MRATLRFLFVALVASLLLALAYIPGCVAPDGRQTDYGRAVGEGAHYAEVGSRALGEVMPEPAGASLRLLAEAAAVVVAAAGGYTASAAAKKKTLPPA